MDTPEKLYKYFNVALQWFVKKKGHGAQNYLAVVSGKSESCISQVIKGNRKAVPETQVAISTAAGYTYEEFLALGRRLLADKETSSPETQGQISEPGKIYNFNAKTDSKVIELDNKKYVLENLLDMARDVLASDYRLCQYALASNILIFAETVRLAKKENKHKKTSRKGNTL